MLRLFNQASTLFTKRSATKLCVGWDGCVGYNLVWLNRHSSLQRVTIALSPFKRSIRNPLSLPPNQRCGAQFWA
jgi:hypothetical protein